VGGGVRWNGTSLVGDKRMVPFVWTICSSGRVTVDCGAMT